MFKFLKNKLKDAVDTFSSKVEEQAQDVSSEELTQEEKDQLVQEKTQDISAQETSLEDSFTKKSELAADEDGLDTSKKDLTTSANKSVDFEDTSINLIKDSVDSKNESVTSQEDLDADTQEKKGFFKRMFKKKSSEENFDVLDEKTLSQEQRDIDFTTENAQEFQHKQELVKPFDNKEELVADKKTVDDTLKVSKKDTGVSDEKSSTFNLQPPKKEAVHKELFEDSQDVTQQKKSLFRKVTQKIKKFQLTDENFEELFWDFELALLENNVALEVIEKIKNDLKESLTQERVFRKHISQLILTSLRQSLENILDVQTFDLLQRVSSKKPFIISVVGVNGSGKTTTLAKLIHLFKKNGLSVVVAAADTFRAAAIQQLEEHTTKLGVKLIKHDYEADPSAVAFDAIKHAQAKNIDVVLIDTAGRLQSNSNLMGELEKLVRVNKPDLSLFVGESITGNDCVEQAVAFNKAVGIDGIILSKADVDEKGGAAISVSYVTKKPILYLGVGQTYDDLVPFDKSKILDELGF
ncbi:MAG: signal recognition particle-docking protein FtsY [Candidatus Woesearchaeota archaeon]